ncbi:MAG: UpxY family transcription antiterminator [Acidobacteria bacterium]|nr:UpxY family transcription antiterminator [Acidobacteriota bacterium]
MEDRTLAWYAVTVKPRAEKAVAEALQKKGYESFLPLYASQREWSDRIKTIHMPLFSGYVFLHLDITRRLPVLKTPGVVSFVSLGAEPTPIETSEIESIRLLMHTGLPVGPWPYLRAGQEVEVTRGALKGIRGILLKVKAQLRLVLSLSLLQRSVVVEVDRDDVRPILRS